MYYLFAIANYLLSVCIIGQYISRDKTLVYYLKFKRSRTTELYRVGGVTLLAQIYANRFNAGVEAVNLDFP